MTFSEVWSRITICKGTNVPSRTDTALIAEQHSKQGEDLASLLLRDGPTSDQESEVLLS